MDQLTTAEVVSKYGTSVRTVHRMVAAGGLHYIKKLPGLRGAYLFDAHHVAEVFRKRAKGDAA